MPNLHINYTPFLWKEQDNKIISKNAFSSSLEKTNQFNLITLTLITVFANFK